ncbi:Trm112 family protein, partial [Streptomyces diastatochromogenes]
KEQDTELICTGQDCGLAYPVRDGIPVLLVDEARRPA